MNVRPMMVRCVSLAAACLAIAATVAAQQQERPRRQRTVLTDISSIEKITPTRGGPPLILGTRGDASDDAKGEAQLFEQIFVAGATDVPAPVQGVAVVDLDGDGLLDIFLSQGGELRLLVNRGELRFEEHPLSLEGETTGSQSPSFADLNGDGFLDFYLASVGPTQRSDLFISQGRWDAFKDMAGPMGVENAGAYSRGQVAIGDVDGDGWLDMAIAANAIGISGERGGRPLSRLYVFRPAADGVFEHGRFEDIGGSAAIPGFGGVDPERPDPDTDINGMSCMLRDWDDDGDLDFIRAGHNDMLRGDPLNPFATGGCPYGVFAWRNLLRETGALRFEPIEPGPPSLAEVGKAHYDRDKGHYVHEARAIAGETVMSADTDNDGDLDVLITGVMGPTVMVHSLWISARFWENLGGLRFRAATEDAGLSALNWWAGQWHRFWGWDAPQEPAGIDFAPRGATPEPKGTQRFRLADHKLYFGGGTFGDFDNDGWLDYVQVTRFGGRPETRGNWRSVLFVNRQNGYLDPVTTEVSGINELGLAGRAVDLDNDGLLELVLMRRTENNPVNPLMVFWNTGRQLGADRNHWIRVRLAGLPERRLLGAKIFAYDSGERVLLGRREYFGDMMRGCQAPDAHFGLGRRDDVDLLVVLPDGSARSFENLAANRAVELDVTGGRDRGDAYRSGTLAGFVNGVIADRRR